MLKNVTILDKNDIGELLFCFDDEDKEQDLCVAINYGEFKDSVLLIEKDGYTYNLCQFFVNQEKEIYDIAEESGINLKELLEKAYHKKLNSSKETRKEYYDKRKAYLKIFEALSVKEKVLLHNKYCRYVGNPNILFLDSESNDILFTIDPSYRLKQLNPNLSLNYFLTDGIIEEIMEKTSFVSNVKSSVQGKHVMKKFGIY